MCGSQRTGPAPALGDGDVEGGLPSLGWGSADAVVQGCLKTSNNLLLTQR